MGRKRGGLAGLWDRSKGVIKPVATGLAGFFGTPALGAAVGAAMGGLDREGKSGIGFDAKGGLQGAASGYAMGGLGNMAGNLATKAGMNLGQGALSKLNTGGGKLANAFLGKAPAPIPPTTPPVAGATGNTPLGLGVGTPADFQNAAASLPSSAGASAPLGTPNLAGSLPGAVPATTPGLGALTATPGQMFNAGAQKTGLRGSFASLGESVAKNPNPWAIGAQAAGKALTSGSENRANDANARLTAAQAAQMEYDNERKRKSDLALESIRQQLLQQMMDRAKAPRSF